MLAESSKLLLLLTTDNVFNLRNTRPYQIGKRALSSPDNELDSEHKRAYQSIMDSPLASHSCEPISLSEEAIQKISDTLVATLRAHIETIVENVVTYGREYPPVHA
ncbi:hypothetical protein DPMN_187986 [Dreissena polymorpha]|uniref:Uncharacterized protein n=1 Tax=Dreissena polymorpha TaxID=45954 RepID=A0A9D4DQ23_DREPO|nr:hypothetical protein DPMN_187986 [Dreissena polymorpha]